MAMSNMVTERLREMVVDWYSTISGTESVMSVISDSGSSPKQAPHRGWPAKKRVSRRGA